MTSPAEQDFEMPGRRRRDCTCQDQAGVRQLLSQENHRRDGRFLPLFRGERAHMAHHEFLLSKSPLRARPGAHIGARRPVRRHDAVRDDVDLAFRHTRAD